MTSVTEYDPDAGGVGYLTWDEWDHLTKAWVTAIKHLPWWWSTWGRIGQAFTCRKRLVRSQPLGRRKQLSHGIPTTGDIRAGSSPHALK